MSFSFSTSDLIKFWNNFSYETPVLYDIDYTRVPNSVTIVMYLEIERCLFLLVIQHFND